VKLHGSSFEDFFVENGWYFSVFLVEVVVFYVVLADARWMQLMKRYVVHHGVCFLFPVEISPAQYCLGMMI